MISVFEVVVDPDMTAPHPFYILRSTGQFVEGGFESTTTSIPLFGPVQQASDKEIQMLPEADRIGAIRSFWCTQQVFTTRGYAPVPGTHGEVPVGTGAAFVLSTVPPSSSIMVYADGLLLNSATDYTLAGTSLGLATAATSVYVTWPVILDIATNASDIIQYDSEQYRVLRVYRDPGSGYWKAYGTRMAAA
jgi:hypothetical protein